MTDKIEINFKSIRKNSTSCVCKIDGKFLFVFHDSVIVPSSSSSVLVVKPCRESLKRFLRLEKELKKMSTDVFDDAEEISSVVVDAEKGKLIRCRLKEPLEQKRGEKEKVTLTLRLVGVRLTRMVSELIWDFVKSEKEEKEEDQKEEVTNQKKSKNKKCEIPDSDSESEEVVEGEEEEVTDCVGDAIEDLRADLLETLNHKVRCAKRDMDDLQRKLTKFQEWLEELDERKRVTLDTIERISAQPEVNEGP